jgi:type I restriction enzyme M protein
MTLMLDPEPGESVYDPTCGTGGMLLSAAVELRRQGKEHRSLRLYGQELNLMTSAIARTNLFLHGIEDFAIARGNTLSDPKFVEGDRLRKFDVVLANPPYSISQWDRSLFAADPWGRNIWGTPPQGRADFAFFQHIACSLKAETGRCAVLFPHGVLFRNDEREMRYRLLDSDILECVLGLGAGLFYNSPMEACVVICRTRKPDERNGKVLIIDASSEYAREQAQSFLRESHISKIVDAYRGFHDIPGFARVVSLDQIRANDANLSIALYGSDGNATGNVSRSVSIEEAIAQWEAGSREASAAVADGLALLRAAVRR